MKIEQVKETFKPVVITLETKEEFLFLLSIIGGTSERTFRDITNAGKESDILWPMFQQIDKLAKDIGLAKYKSAGITVLNDE